MPNIVLHEGTVYNYSFECMSLREPKANFPLEEVLNCLLALGTLGRKLVCLEYLVNLRA